MALIKAIWRFLMGVKDFLALCFLLIFFAGLYAMLSISGGDRPIKAHEGALYVNLDGYLVEQPRRADPTSYLMSAEVPSREYRLRDIVTALEAAKTDSKVKAVVLDLDGFMGGGQVALSRVGKALDALKSAGKPVLSYATAYEDDGYQLAAHASEIWVNPLGGVALLGPGGENLYYKGLIDKLGVTAHIFRVGTYKSAVEPYMRADQSPDAKQASQALVDHLWSNWQQEVTKARPSAQVASYSSDPVAAAKATNGNLPAAAQKAGLVDKIGERDAFESRVASLAGKASENQEGPAFAAIDLGDYIRAKTSPNDGQIGVITVAGEIVDGIAAPGTAGGDSIATLLKEALAEKKLKALVVRVDSPGGSVLASEQIRSAILAAKAKGLPVVVSMGNVAASGGYWISTPANRILAEPSTITGSIGIFGIIPSFENSLAKIGITTDGVKSTPLSGEPNVMGGLSPEFQQISQLGIEDMYRRFLTLVGQSRHMQPASVDKIAQGRVWDGGTARQLGLVDQFGGLEDAIGEAAKLARLDPAKARPYYIEPEADRVTLLLEQFMGADATASAPSGKDMLARQAIRQRALLSRAITEATRLAEGASIQASCLECAPYRKAALPAPVRNPGLIGQLLRMSGSGA